MIAAGIVSGMTSATEVPYARRLGAGPLEIALYIALPSLGILIVDLFGSRLVPRLEARAILTLGLVMFALSEAALGLTGSIGLLMPARVLQGLGSGFVMGSSLQAALRVDQNRARSLGSYNGAYLLGTAVGAPLGGFIASLLAGLAGYRLAFYACCATAVFAAVAIMRLLPSLPAAADAGRPRIGLPRLQGPPGLGPAMLLGSLGDLLRGSVVYTTIPLAGLARHYSPATIGVAVGLLVGTEIVAMRVLSRLIGRLGLTHCLMTTLGLGVFTAASFVLFRTEAAYLIGASVFGITLAGAVLAPALLIVSLDEDDPASGLASYRIASGTGMLVGATGAGTAVAAIGAPGVFGAVAVVMAGSVVMTHHLRRRLDPA
jgi:predicted MFS family arabinose efflux permease